MKISQVGAGSYFFTHLPLQFHKGCSEWKPVTLYSSQSLTCVVKWHFEIWIEKMSLLIFHFQLLLSICPCALLFHICLLWLSRNVKRERKEKSSDVLKTIQEIYYLFFLLCFLFLIFFSLLLQQTSKWK